MVSRDALKGITVKTSYSDYEERNPKTIKTDYGNGITTTEDLTYISKGSLFFNKIASRQITKKATGQTDVVRKEYFLFDNKGNIIYNVKDSTDVNKVQTFYSNYDNYGNPRKVTTTTNSISRSQSMTYCSYGRFLKTEIDNQFNDTTTYHYDESKGLLISKIDRLGTTTYDYDNFGRLKLTTYPNNIKTANTLQWAGTIAGKPTNAKYYSYSETSLQSPVWVWYDALGREIRRDSYGLNNKKIMVTTEYNFKGQVSKISEPYFAENANNKLWEAIYTYDRFGRDSTVVTQMGTTTYVYSDTTVTVISPSGTKKTTINSAGWVVEEETNGKKVNFTYYASGLVKTTTPQGGPPITLHYDLQGNRIKIDDPDAGVITSKYDGWGQLKQEKQKIHIAADSILTTYNYLPSGLLSSKSRNGETTNYGYDNLYRLKWISIAGKHSQGFVYDQYDYIVQSNDTVDGSKVFVRKTEYDQYGRVSKEIYPGDYFITNYYDKYSYLTGITDGNNTGIWQALESNSKDS